jgi:hypothetical protein
MISSNDSNQIQGNNSLQDSYNNENISENESEINYKTHYNLKKREPLKNIGNIIPDYTNDINAINTTSAKTTIKQSNILLDSNKYKTFPKKSNNNSLIYSNEEKYSLLKIKKIKSNKFSPYKSTNHLYNKVENEFDKEKNDSKVLYFKLKKHKKIYSLNKVYMSHLSFKNENNISKEFKLFRDCDIGLNDGHKVKQQFEDFDVESDDEIKNNGEKRCILNLGTAIEMLQNRNEEYVSKYMTVFDNY